MTIHQATEKRSWAPWGGWAGFLFVILLVGVQIPGSAIAAEAGTRETIESWIDSGPTEALPAWAIAHPNEVGAGFDRVVEAYCAARLSDDAGAVKRIGSLVDALLASDLDDDVRESIRERWERYCDDSPSAMRAWLQCRRALDLSYSLSQTGIQQSRELLSEVMGEHPDYPYARMALAMAQACDAFFTEEDDKDALLRLRENLLYCDDFPGDVRAQATAIWGQFVLSRAMGLGSSFQTLSIRMDDLVDHSGNAVAAVKAGRPDPAVHSWFAAVISHAAQRPLEHSLHAASVAATSDPECAAFQMLHGHLLAEDGRCEAAAAAFADLSHIAPERMEALYYQARALVDAGRASDALAVLAKIPADAQLLHRPGPRLTRCRALYLVMDLKAADALETALYLDSESASYALIQGLRARAEGDWQGAWRSYFLGQERSARELSEFTEENFISFAAYQYLLAEAELALGRPGAALPRIWNFARQNPESDKGMEMLADAEFGVELLDDAQTHYMIALRRAPRPELWRKAGDMFVARQEFQLAAESYAKAVEVDSAELHAGLMRLAMADGNVARAEAEARAVMQRAAPDDAIAAECGYWLGMFAWDAGRKDEALTWWKRLWEVTPPGAAMRSHLLYLIRREEPAFQRPAATPEATTSPVGYALLAAVAVCGLWIYSRASRPARRKARHAALAKS